MMSTKSNTIKKRVSKNAKGIKTHFKVWVGVLIVLIVAVVGVVVIRFSEASNAEYFGDYAQVVKVGNGYGWEVYEKDVGFGRYLFWKRPGGGVEYCFGALGKNTTEKKWGNTRQANMYKRLNCNDIPHSTYINWQRIRTF